MKFFRINPDLIRESAIPKTPVKQLDEIELIEASLDDNLGQEVKIPKDVLDSFKIKDTLNPKIWDNFKLNPKVQTKLIKTANEFIKEMKLPKGFKLQDIIFTGSLANYNWSKFSDIDLHIVLDYNQFEGDPQMTEDFFYLQKTLWNDTHDITVFDYPVELYAQDSNQELVATAVYSVLRNKWIKKPVREEFKIDKESIKNKAQNFINKLKDIRKKYKKEKYQAVVDDVTKIKDKIKQMRKAGLESGGEFSQENLVFKTLRRTPFMDVLDSFKIKAFDNLMSVVEMQSIDEVKYLPYDPKPELKDAGAYPSLSQSSSRADVKEIKYRIAKALVKANQYKTANPQDNYFVLPQDGDGFYQVEFRHDGNIRTKQIRPSGDMEQRGGKFQPSDIGTCKTFQNIARYCFVKAGKNGGAVGASPAEDAANKALIIYQNEILDFYKSGDYGDEETPQYADSKMDDKTKQHKIKKDLEMKLKRRLTDTEWNHFLQTGEEPSPKSTTISMSPQEREKFLQKQAATQAKIDAIKARRNKGS